ncbi:MAG TPA: lytic murein transglycosylase B [Burkholderiales bacterium]|nr:lytic murein transglycosylase B [Burkholderiales bacterium]
MGSNPTLSANSFFCLRPLLLVVAMLPHAHVVAATGQLAPEIEAFIQDMVQKHRFNDEALRKLFAGVEPNPAVISQISAPLTALPWHQFRSRYVNAVRVDGGIAFWREHAATLARARREFGVPEEVVVATIGIESIYGRNTGRFGVLEALTMLAFNYPPRAALFRSELESYLLLTREARFDAGRVKGSYAGAIGIPQFLPSSYRRYAVDFDGDGRRDLLGSPADAIGSVANYYKSHGWRAGEIIAVPAEVDGGNAAALLELGIKPRLSVGALKRRGVSPAAPVEEDPAAALITAESETGPSYWLGLNNFYVITRYNRSINYALAVDELARELRARFQQGN